MAVWGVNFSWPRTPGFPSAPVRTCPALSDPGGPDASGLYDAPDIAFRYREGVGSAFRQLSRLHHPACTLAVYASQLGLLRQTPRKTRFPLTATLGGRGLSPLGLQQEVSTLFCSFTSHRFFLLGTYPGAPRPLPARTVAFLLACDATGATAARVGGRSRGRRSTGHRLVLTSLLAGSARSRTAWRTGRREEG